MRLKQISKRSLAIILSVLMVLSTLMVGTISTANAADTSTNTSSAEISANTSGAVPETIYFYPGPWDDDTSAWFQAWAWKDNQEGVWLNCTAGPEDGYYTIDNSGGYQNIKMLRKGPSHASDTWEKWNETGNIDIPETGENRLEITGWSSNNYSWSYYYQSMNFSGGYIYFDNTNSAWTDSHIMLLIGNDTNTRVQDMEKLEGTNLYYCSIASYDNAKYFAVVGDNNSWNDKNPSSGFDTRTGSSTNHYTYVCTNYCFNSGSTYLLTPNDGTTDTGLTPSNLSSYDAFNSTQTAKVQLSTDGSSYSDSTTAGTIQISSYKMSDNGTSTAVSQQSSAVSVNAAKTATVTLTATASNGCEFVGWYDANGVQKSTSTTFTYTANGAATYYARFTDEATPIDPNKEYSINYTSQDGVTLSYPATAKAGDTVTVTVDVEDGYTCTIVSVNDTEKTVTDGKITFTMPASNVTLTTNVAVKALSTEWDIYGYGNDSTVNSDMNPADLIKGTMNGVEFAYYELNVDNTNDFRFMIGKNDTKYEHQNNNSQSTVEYLNTYGADVTINNHGADNINFAKVSGQNTYYIVLYYPNTNYGTWNGINIDNSSNSKAVVCAYTDLPGDGYKDKFQVSIEQGVNDYYLDATRGTSTLETGNTTDRFEYDNNTVTFTTETKKVTNADLGVTDMYIYRVYGYSILITYKDNSKRVVAIDEHAISTPEKGKYSAQYTFVPNETGSEVKSAVVTPLFTSSEEYAELKGVNYTTVYLKVQPGDNLFDNTYEPRCYTWRIVETSGGNTQSWVDSNDGKKIQSLPEGWWKGQKMLYIGNGMYKAVVEDQIKGITFVSNDSDTQTFDYSEFIKLQNLGYDQITFEPKKGVSGGVASNLNSKYDKNANAVYTKDTTDCSLDISETLTNQQFELDVNIEGYYVDVFGNKLEYSQDAIEQYNIQDKNIRKSDLSKYLNNNIAYPNTHEEATALLSVLKTPASDEQALYGARYGVVKEDKYYGMTYATRAYYFEVTGDKTYMVSQQVSGYGTIEGANSPVESGKTNAVAYYNSNESYMQYANGTDETVGNFVNGYELISDRFKGVPYFVSYQAKVDKRIDGKWYYQDTTPVLPYDLQMGLMGSDNKVIMDDTTNEIDVNPIGGTAIFTESGTTHVEIESGKTTTLIATPNPGYKFVGFYEPNGTRLSSNNNYVYTVASSGTIFAVFKALEEHTVVVNNNIYRGNNPKDGGGNGDVTVTLYIYDSQTDTTPEVYTGKNSVQAEILEGKWFRWVITGKPAGLDKFIAFRAPDIMSGEYGKLDVIFEEEGYGYQYNAATGVHSYTSDFMRMDWENYPTDSLVIDNYTDFNKTSYKVNLHYCYEDRYGNEKEYIVTNIELTTDEMKADFTPSDTTIKNNAPYIDEVFKDCRWEILADRTNLSQTGADYYLKAQQKDKQFYTYVKIDANKYVNKSTYNDTVSIYAPPTKEDGTVFLYWTQQKVDSDGNPIGNSIGLLSYYNRAKIRVTFDSIVTAFYGKPEDIPNFATNVQAPEYTREQYTENGVYYDYIYADLLLQYDISKKIGDGATLKDYIDGLNKAGTEKIKFGFILENEYGQSYTGDGDPVGPSVNTSYMAEYQKNLETLVKESSDKFTARWSAATDSEAEDYNFYYNIYDLSENVSILTDLGRMDYVLRIDNKNEANKNIVYNVYSYILYTDANGDQTVYFSNPQILSIFDIATSVVKASTV